MPNTDVNGIRYGVISFNALKAWCNEDLFYGGQARDLSYEDALAELKAEGKRAYVNLLEEADISAAESGADREPGFDLDDWEEKWFDHNEHKFDEEDFVSDYVERNAEEIQIDEPVIEGELDGVKYRISWLGGAPLLWSTSGPCGYAAELCSPCVPGAANLNGGFVLPSEPGAGTSEFLYHCYIVPKEWLRDE